MKKMGMEGGLEETGNFVEQMGRENWGKERREGGLPIEWKETGNRLLASSQVKKDQSRRGKRG
jgi:hypothetical protein